MIFFHYLFHERMMAFLWMTCFFGLFVFFTISFLLSVNYSMQQHVCDSSQFKLPSGIDRITCFVLDHNNRKGLCQNMNTLLLKHVDQMCGLEMLYKKKKHTTFFQFCRHHKEFPGNTFGQTAHLKPWKVKTKLRFDFHIVE